ncbi:phosphate uptake regulator PhoU [Clostridium sp. CAG:632]|jgi:phosphate transport system protein|nr:phosphate signaling complex protein PhoU [Lachnospiraceae bacterium]MBS6465326.1 phosphate signaling complex protein PhoU [Clostridium sp.]CCY59431.1 phosphate uptake regulator PhoU [Clostridium sp. CAG:632]
MAKQSRFEKQLNTLNQQMVQMGSMVEQSIEMAVSALVTKDSEKAHNVIEYAADVSNQERQIEGMCMKLLLCQQPVASDLRMISSALKMITDMERIAVQSAEISELTIRMEETPYIKKLEHVQQMAKETILMVVKSIDAFVNKDLELAQEVISMDDVVDDLFIKIKQELIGLINQDASNGEQATDLLMIGKYFERIGDHAVNIAQWVTFSITGEHGEIN